MPVIIECAEDAPIISHIAMQANRYHVYVDSGC